MLRSKLAIVWVVLGVLALMTAAQARERYVLAFWRELGKHENNGCLYMRVWAMRQDGALLQNVQVLDQNGFQLGATEASGRADVTFDRVTEPIQLQVTDVRGRESDLTPIMCTQRYPDRGTYSYEMLFVLKDEASPGVFDTRLYGTVNLPGETNSDAPCTRSLAYRSWDPLNRTTDSFATTSWDTEHGQTFVADGDRVRAVMLHGVIGGTEWLTFTAGVLNGGPGGSVIASATSANHSSIDPWLVGFGENACPLTPGAVHYLRMTRPGGLSAYVMTNNTYPSGTYYLYGNPITAQDIKGYVCCEKVGPSVIGTFSGTVRDSSGQPLSGAIVSVDSTYRKSTSQEDGSYSLGSLLPGTYTVRVFRQGYTSQERTGVAVAEGQNVQLDFVVCPMSPNLVQNPGFETGLLAPWSKTGMFDGVQSAGYLSVPSHSGDRWAGRAVQNGSAFGGWAYQILSVTPQAEYTASSFFYTDSYSSFLRTSEWPKNCKARIGLDPTGGTNPGSSTVVWGPVSYSHNAWSPISVSARATGPSMTVFLNLSQTLSKAYNVVAFDDVYVGTINASGKLTAVQAMPDGTRVHCFGQLATASTEEMGRVFYMQEPDRTRGLRVVTSETVARGAVVSVSGVLRNVDGERFIEAESVVTASTGATPRPLAVGAKTILDRHASVAGLLVRTWGRVTATGDGYVEVNDGAAEVKVYTTAAVAPWSFVRATGAVGAEMAGGVVRPVIRCRSVSDLIVEP